MLYFWMLCAAAVGGACRFLLSNWVAHYWQRAFPLPTLVVNLSGALLLGVLWAGQTLQQLSQTYWQIYALAALGSFTTVSSLNLQLVSLWRNQNYLNAIGYLILSVLGGLGLLLLGSYCGQMWW